MPYVLRDASGKVTRATVQSVPGADMLPYNHPDLVAFLESNGQSLKKIEETLDELRRTDMDMARAIEDVVMALFKKNILKMTDLPKPVQEKMAYRVKLRMMIQETLDQASGRSDDASFSASAQLPPLY